MLKETSIGRGSLGTVRSKDWWYEGFELQYQGSKEVKKVYRLYCNDFRKFIYADGHFRQSGSGQQGLPATIKKRFLESIK